MIRRHRFLLLLLCIPLMMWADNWNYITSSGQYYYGVGKGATEAEADRAALEALTTQIATHVSSDFIEIDDETSTNGVIDHKSRVLNCVRTYSSATLTNTMRWVSGSEPNVTVRRYMERKELQRIFEGRIERAKGMVQIADECLQGRKIDMALEYYYHAYSLIRSVQYPNEVRGTDGSILVNVLPMKIRQILSGIRVSFEDRADDRVNLRFDYEGQPVSSLGFTYNDGRADGCEGWVKDGRGSIEMAPGYENRSAYHIHINYEYIEQTRGDAEMESVLNVITKKVFPQAGIAVEAKGGGKPATAPAPVMSKSKALTAGINLQPDAEQTITDVAEYARIMGQVVEAARTRSLSNVDKYFTIDGGLPRYRALLKMGVARVVGTPNIAFFRGLDGHVVARGLQMSLTYNSRGRKKTFVEDVVFTFNADRKIENVTFGLGQTATDDILCKHPGWDNQTRELLMEFLENYKTAYCMKDSAYIRQIFVDDAVIIIGNVAKAAPVSQAAAYSALGYHEQPMSIQGRELIRYNRYTKDEYLRNLRRCFDRNEFINLRFSHNDIQRLEKFSEKELFGIQIGQEYSSSTYSDVGFLFLLTDLTDHNQPIIKVRTWQPNEVNMDSIYHAGRFFDK